MRLFFAVILIAAIFGLGSAGRARRVKRFDSSSYEKFYRRAWRHGLGYGGWGGGYRPMWGGWGGGGYPGFYQPYGWGKR
ncbi:unnamed protein product [Cylicostephanus goldi]|uniref:Sulfur globule protein CV3 n=1 Tax=Cylicostephanus goldi TaxID=71465 RepID=A0A3P7N1G3_CYLGO|nr:unnamed protein product [Cylicostephanus goldi]